MSVDKKDTIEVGDVVDVESQDGRGRHITQATKVAGGRVYFISETGKETSRNAYRNDGFVKLVMKSEVYEALLASIEHWMVIVEEGGMIGSNACPLCKVFLNKDDSYCNKPGYNCLLETNAKCCKEWAKLFNHNKRCSVGFPFYSVSSSCIECKRLSQVMLDKLIALDPLKDSTPVKEEVEPPPAKYAVNQRVRVRAGLVENRAYSGTPLLAGMAKERGKEFCIQGVEHVSPYGFIYSFTNNTYVWSEDMLKPVPEQTFKVGDKIKSLGGDWYRIVATEQYFVLINTNNWYGCYHSVTSIEDLLKQIEHWKVDGRFVRND